MPPGTPFANSYGLPLPIPDLPFAEQFDMMKSFLESLVEDGTNAILSQCETRFLRMEPRRSIHIVRCRHWREMRSTLIAEKAMNDKRSQWKPPQIVPVLNGNGMPICVKQERQMHCVVSVSRCAMGCR